MLSKKAQEKMSFCFLRKGLLFMKRNHPFLILKTMVTMVAFKESTEKPHAWCGFFETKQRNHTKNREKNQRKQRKVKKSLFEKGSNKKRVLVVVSKKPKKKPQKNHWLPFFDTEKRNLCLTHGTSGTFSLIRRRGIYV